MKYKVRKCVIYPCNWLSNGFGYFTDWNGKYSFYLWNGRIKCYRTTSVLYTLKSMTELYIMPYIENHYTMYKRRKITIPIR